MKASLLKESDEHDTLRVAIQLVFDDLELAPEQEMSLFAVHGSCCPDYGLIAWDREGHTSLWHSPIIRDRSLSL